MKRLSACLLALGLVAACPAVLAQSNDLPYDDGDTPAQAGAYVESDPGTYYDYAQVIRVDPVLVGGDAPAPSRICRETAATGRYESYEDRRYGWDSYSNHDPYYDRYAYYGRDAYGDRRYGTRAGSNTAAVIGGIAGALLGSQMGGGTGAYAATAVGSMLGSMAGREIYEQRQRELQARSGTVQVCEPEPVRDDGYSGSGDGRGGYDVTYEYNGRQYTRRMDYNPGDRIRVRVDVSPE